MPPTDETLSGIPPVITLSGIPAGAQGFSGASQQSLSGDPAYGAARPGFEGGPSLMDLLQQQQLQQLLAGDTSAAAGLGLGQSLTAPTFGQSIGGLGAGGFGQGFGVAGQMGTGPGAGNTAGMIAGAGGGTTADTLALLAKALGLTKTGISLASPTQQGLPGSTSNPITESTSPDVIAQLGQQNASDLYGGAAGGRTPYGQQQLEAFGLSPQEANDILKEQGNTLLYGGPDLPGYNPSLGASTAGSSPSSQGIGAGSGGGLSGTTNIGGALQGGLSGTAGLLNLLQSLQSGNVPGAVGGGLQGAGGLAQLLSGLGLGGTALSGVGSAAGGLGGLLSLIQGIRGLGNGETAGQAASSIGGGALGAYSGAAGLANAIAGSEVIPGLLSGGTTGGGLLGGAVSSIAPEFAGQVAGEVAANAANVGAGVGAGAGELGAGATAGVVAAPLLITMILDMISKMQDASRVQSFIPEFQQTLASIPGVVSAEQGAYPTLAGLNANTTPEQALAALQQFQGAQSQYQNTGVEGLLKYGQGGPAGDFGQGNAFKFNQADNVLNALREPSAANLLGELRAEDILGRAGYTPDQIPGFMGPEAFALALNSAQNTAGQQGIPQYNQDGTPFAGTLGGLLRPGNLQVDPATGQGELGPPTGYESTPSGVQNSALLAQINALKPGGMEQGLVNLLQSYGGINPLFSPFGMLTPNQAPGQAIQQPVMSQISAYPDITWGTAP